LPIGIYILPKRHFINKFIFIKNEFEKTNSVATAI